MEKQFMQYAKLTLAVGLNLQKDQELFITCPINNADLGRALVKEAYAMGAKEVVMFWDDDLVTRQKYEHAAFEVFGNYPQWKADAMNGAAERGAAFLRIVGGNPDLLKGIDPTRMSTANKSAAKALASYRKEQQTGGSRWCIIAAPSLEWAEKVYPELEGQAAIDALWTDIFKIVRTDQADPVAAWQAHIDQIREKHQWLTDMQPEKLIFKSDTCDLTMDMPKDHLWIGGGITDKQDIYYVPNLPTEECFSLPHRNGVNGTVTSTKPLNWGGALIEDFTLTLKDGKIVAHEARVGEEVLTKLLDTDEGARYIGEVALVPESSPINQTNRVFYNTLYDENASSHLAIGTAYPMCLKGGTKLEKEALLERGANHSLTHVDFMIGSDSLNVDAVLADGTTVPVFRKGEWA